MASVKEWLETSLWEGGYFSPERLPARLELYSSGVRFPLVTSFPDGCGVLAAWPSDRGKTKTETLLNRLRPMVRRLKASWFYVTDPDDVCSLFEWEEVIDPEYFNAQKLRVFETHPAAEGAHPTLAWRSTGRSE